jgi:hypothetical protein
MCGLRGLAVVGLCVLVVSGVGCQSSGSRRAPEPSLSGALDSKGSIAESTPPRTVSYVDRHPLLSKPRDYWDSSGDNKIVKAGAATFIGVPVGIYGELKQIVVGTTPEVR